MEYLVLAKNEIKNFYINAKSSTLSFNKLNKNLEGLNKDQKKVIKMLKVLLLRVRKQLLNQEIIVDGKINKIKYWLIY